jgi:alpha-tubulin suppressor-like RCC1 family protein
MNAFRTFCAVLTAGVALYLSLSSHAQQIAAKNGHVLAASETGELLAWGGDSFGQLGQNRSVLQATPTRIQGIPTIRTIATGDAHMLAIDTTGAVWSWGNNTDGQLGIRDELNNARPSRVRGLTGVTAIAAGGNFSAAVTADGSVYVWGRHPITKEGVNVPERLEGVRGARSLSAGRAHLIIMRTDGTVLAAGENAAGQLGDGTVESRNVLVRIPRLSGVAQIDSQGDYNVALTADGRPFAWGTADSSRPTETRLTSPTLVRDAQQIAIARGSAIVQVALGAAGGYLLLANSDVLYWQQVETSLSVRFSFPGAVELRVTPRSPSSTAFGRRADGTIIVSGYNGEGQWGQGTTSEGSFFENVEIRQLDARMLRVGTGYAAILNGRGEVLVWGANAAGVMADGGISYRAVPARVDGSVPAVRKVVAGRGFSLALTTTGEVYAWGENASGQLGIGSRTRVSQPTRVTRLSNIVDIAAGCDFSLFLNSDGRIQYSGFLFDSLNTSPNTLTLSSATYRRVFATCESAFGVTEGGGLRSWGRNDRGQLGLGYVTPSVFSPSAVLGITTEVVEVAGGDTHTVARTADGKVWTWGDNTRGQLGSPPTPFDATPQFIANLPAARGIAAGRHHTLMLFQDGTVGGVGGNTGGELGTGTRTDTSVVAPVRRLTDVIAITAGVSTSYAIRSDGSTWAWGRSTESAFQESIGDGTYVDRVEPVLVLAANAGGNLDRGDWFLDLKPGTPNRLPAGAERSIVPVAQLFGGNQGASLAASINFREQDYGKQAGTYVMGLVPRKFLDVAEVAAAENPVERHAEIKRRPVTKADSDLVLVQLTPTGWQVVTGQLTALTTNVIAGNSTAQRILNNVNLALIPGAQFCVGYGTDANNMLQSGTLAEVLTIPGAAATSGGLPCLRSGAYLSGPDESRVGEPVTFTAIVVGISPTGTVELRNGTNRLDSKALPGSGETIARSVRFEFASFTAARYSLQASYAGDGTPNNPAATSATLAHRRQALPGLTLSAPSTSDAGQSVTFTARLTAAAGATGNIVFKDDGVPIALPVPLADGQAAVTVRDLAPGAHSITAEYAGDDLNAAVRASLAHTVRSNAVDTEPDRFTFAERSDTERSVWIVSDSITVAGVNAAAAISIIGGEYSIACGDSYTTAPGAIDGGQRVCVRHRASDLAQAATTTTLTIGGVSAAFVSRTKADPQGLPAEGDFDFDGIPNAVEISEQTNPRVRDNDVFTNGRLFVMQVYRDSLDREGDTGGIGFWTNEINAGRQTRLAMLELFLASPEFEGRIAPVIRLYLAYFGRVPDYAGLKFWQSQVVATGLDGVSEAFAGSSEFATRTRSLSDEAYVRFVFENTIGRAPDAGGLAFWTAKLRFSEISRGQLMARFSESAEYRQVAGDRVSVIALYAAMLRRTPEDAGLTYWVAERRRVGNSQALAGAFFAAAEYRARFLD